MRRYRVHGPIAHYAPAPGGGKTMQSFAPNHLIDVDEDDEAAVEHYDRWVDEGLAEVVDEAVTPVSPAGPAGGAGSLPGTLADRVGATVTDEPEVPPGPRPGELPGTDADAVVAGGVPVRATGSGGVVEWLGDDGISPAERVRRAEAAEVVEAGRPGGERSSVVEAVERARRRAEADEVERAEGESGDPVGADAG